MSNAPRSLDLHRARKTDQIHVHDLKTQSEHASREIYQTTYHQRLCFWTETTPKRKKPSYNEHGASNTAAKSINKPRILRETISTAARENIAFLEQWASISESSEDFTSYAGADLFDLLNGAEKPSGIDVKQKLSLENCEGPELHATTTLCKMYRVLKSGERISMDTVQEDELNHFGLTPEDWYRAFCLLRFYWRDRSREGQEGDGTSKTIRLCLSIWHITVALLLRVFWIISMLSKNILQDSEKV